MKYTASTFVQNYCLPAALLTCTVSLSAIADDIDVYKSLIERSGQKPNILFVLDYSGSMDLPSDSGLSRLEVMRSTLYELVDDNIDTINAGLGSFFQGYDSAGIRWPISELSADANSVDPDIPAGQFTVADIIKRRVAERETDAWTPTVPALVEAAQYFRGDSVTHNDAALDDLYRHRPPRWNATSQQYEGANLDVSIAAAYSPANAYSDDLSQTFYCNDYSSSGGPNYCGDNVVSACESVAANDTATVGYENANNLWGNYQRCEYTRSDNWQTPRFNSPITDTCEAQPNAIVLITDGRPTVSTNGDSLRQVIGMEPDACEDLSTTLLANRGRHGAAGNCALEIVRALAQEPVNPYLPDSQVNTYTIGFNIEPEGAVFLDHLARAGGGEFYPADSAQDLSIALNSAITDIQSSSESFTELSVDVDKTTFSHNNRVYYSVFSPSKRQAWRGNLKGYFVDSAGIVDINGAEAVEDNIIRNEAQSFWSSVTDGADIELGGASEQMETEIRNLYTFVRDNIPAGGADLSRHDNMILDKENNAITNASLWPWR